MIYFIESESGHIKIGYTNQEVNHRFDHLNTSCPFRLKLLKVIDGTIQQEKALHKKFKKYRFHLEWFLKTEELVKFIKNPVLEKPNQTLKIKSKIQRNKNIDMLYKYLFKNNIPKQNLNLLEKVLNTLLPIEKDILKSRYGINCKNRTFREIGRHFSLTGERIRQIEQKALRKLKHPTRTRQLK